MTRRPRAGLAALVAAAAVIWLLPAVSTGSALDLERLDNRLKQATQRLGGGVEQTVAPVRETVRATAERSRRAADAARDRARRDRARRAATRAPSPDPLHQPPLHGSNPHGQGGVAVVDVNPSAERPQGADPAGSDSGEEVVVGRARGERRGDGSYHGHITILALFGSEIAGVDSTPGQTANGPLQPVQAGVLDPLCTATGNQVCLSVLTADSTTTATGSTNRFSAASAKVGGLGVGAAQSTGTISQDANCQTAAGGASTADVSAGGGGAVAQVAQASATSRSCRGQAPQTARSSTVIGLGGTQVPLPAPGCANGTPDTDAGVPAVLPIVCNADDAAGAAVVREALDVFVLNVGGNSLAKETTAAAEATSTAPEAGGPECSDGVDNDGDGLVDAADPGCHTDGNPNNPASYDPNDDSEADRRRPGGGPGSGSGGETGGRPQCSDRRDNDGDGLVDARDPGCHSDGDASNPASYVPSDDDERDRARGSGAGGPGGPECSDGVDNDGDGRVDARDPGCHSDGDANNPASYVPSDDSEADDARSLGAGSLPFTGTDVVGLALAGLLLLAGGLLLRRREAALAG